MTTSPKRAMHTPRTTTRPPTAPPERPVTPADLVAFRAARRPKRGQRVFRQTDAAEWYGCSTRAWEYWEAGQKPIPRPLATRLRAYFATRKAP